MLSNYQLYRAKKKALELIHGAIDEQYTHVRNYVEELLRSNHGSSVKIKCADSDDGPVFQRICVLLCMQEDICNYLQTINWFRWVFSERKRWSTY